MAAIAKFVSFDGGIAFSDSVLKIQKRGEERGRLIPLASIAGVEVDEPLLGDDGCVRVQIVGAKPSARNSVFFDEEQYDDALRFKAAFDEFVVQTSQALPPQELFQSASVVPRSGRAQPQYMEQERPRQPVKQAKRKRRFKWWYAVIAAVLVAILAMPGKKNDEQGQQKETGLAVAEVTASPAPTPEAATEPTQEPTPGDEQVSMDALCSLLELTISPNFEHYDISYEDNSITVSLWQEGLAVEVTAIQMTGGDESNSNWVNLKNSIRSLAESMCGLIDSAGRTDVLLYTSVQNDQNLENTLLMLLETTIIYDCLA